MTTISANRNAFHASTLAVATAIGAVPVRAEDGHADAAWFTFPDGSPYCGLRLAARRGFGSEASRVRFTVSHDAARPDTVDYREVPAFHELETAAAFSRPADVIARQVVAKVLDPALPLLEKFSAIVRDRMGEAVNLAAQVDGWRRDYPGAHVELSRSGRHVVVNIPRGRFNSINAEVDQYGHVRLGSLGTVSADQAHRILAILLEA